uniref:Uncharacterized protein n=1 Tax=Cacopsylla melanoneura TaxID=428564 RepID=A0A8D8ZJG5_9HEMI
MIYPSLQLSAQRTEHMSWKEKELSVQHSVHTVHSVHCSRHRCSVCCTRGAECVKFCTLCRFMEHFCATRQTLEKFLVYYYNYFSSGFFNALQQYTVSESLS